MVVKSLPILPISDLRARAREVITTAKTEPTVITQRGRPRVVMIGHESYNEMVARLEHLEAARDALVIDRAQATGPKILLMDELMAGLNPTEVAEALDLVASIRDRGITIFMIEHVMKAIMSACDRIMVLHHGTKIAEGTPQEIATSKTVVEVYLGE